MPVKLLKVFILIHKCVVPNWATHSVLCVATYLVPPWPKSNPQGMPYVIVGGTPAAPLMHNNPTSIK